MIVRGVVGLVLLLAAACAEPARNLSELVVRDSTYYAPETMEPFSGPVFRSFADDTTAHEVVGALLAGTWHGELVVYHPSGRIRYMGSFAHGQRCGPWTENALDREPEDVYEALTREIATMAIYPPCPPDVQ